MANLLDDNRAARDATLARVRTALGKTGDRSAARAAAEDYVAARAEGPRPRIDGDLGGVAAVVGMDRHGRRPRTRHRLRPRHTHRHQDERRHHLLHGHSPEHTGRTLLVKARKHPPGR